MCGMKLCNKKRFNKCYCFEVHKCAQKRDYIHDLKVSDSCSKDCEDCKQAKSQRIPSQISTNNNEGDSLGIFDTRLGNLGDMSHMSGLTGVS